MASKNKTKLIVADKVCIRRVKRAGMWCRTEFKDNKQSQTWHRSRNEATS